MEKPSTENGAKPTTSTEIERRIVSVKEELANTRQALAKQPKRKAAALGQPALDERALTKIEEDESHLVRREAYLVARLPLLREQLESASAAEAQQRLVQLVTESATLSEQYDKQLAVFHKNAELLRASAEQVIAAFRAVQAAHDEQDYLVLRFTLEAAVLTGPSAPVPHEDDTADAVCKPLADFWQRQNSLAARNEWSRKTHELQNERRYEQQRQAPISVPGHVRATVA